MTTILYNPQSSAGRKPVLPMSLLALGAVLEGEFHYRIVDGNLDSNPLETLAALIQDELTPVLAVTVMGGPQLEYAVMHCRKLKEQHPRLTIIWGGYFPTQHYEVCVNAPYVDYVLRGHADYAFRDLLRCLDADGDPSAIRGVSSRRDTAIHCSNGLPELPDPDELPPFPYHRIDLERYVRSTFMGNRTISHHSSYGCPFLCNFCAVVNMVNGRWKAQSAERTARTVEYLVETWNADAVEFFDNNFFVREDRTAELAERITPLGLRWWGEARIDTMLKYSDQTWKLLQKSGLRMVFLGAESGSNETLKRMNKGGKATAEKTLEIAAKMRQYGIVPEFSFMLGNPPDPGADVAHTLEFIRKVKAVHSEAEIIMYMYTPVPLSGTLYAEARANGFRFPESLEEWISPGWKDFAQRRSVQLPWMEDPLRRKVHNFERVLNAYYPTATDRQLKSIHRTILRGLSGWRYKLGFYAAPLELRLAQRMICYQRPETSGF